ncbi:tonoplast monosaccharide transporter2 [Perilla frutescens var. frutescens]|nr:tonoplast monosaccharide transporter2 [Perilla frutescens var. frutescens]
MNTAVVVAIVAAVGNLIQGWDNAAVGGVIVHIKREFQWEDKPGMVGLTVALSLIGATVITMCSGGISDWIGRRPMLTGSSVLYIVSGVLMLWSPNVYVLLFTRLLAGCAIGLAVTFVPMYISEMAPPEIRGLLSTVPQFMYTGGLFLGYAFIFCMSLLKSSNWRFMLGILFAPSIIFCAMTVFYLPESPRWLLSKGRMVEAKKALQRLRGKEDVSGEMALLVEGLQVGGETKIEEYVIGPPGTMDEEEQREDKEEIRMLGPEGLTSMVALRVSEDEGDAAAAAGPDLVRRQSSMLLNPVVTLMDSVHEKLTDPGSKQSALFSHFGSIFSDQAKNEEWGEGSSSRQDEGDYVSESEELQSPLISRQATRGTSRLQGQGSRLASMVGEIGESSTGIGGGWQLAWKWKEGDGSDGMKEGSFRRVYLHEDSAPGSWRDPGDGELVKAAALVSQSALSHKQLLMHHNPNGMLRPSTQGPRFTDLLEPGVKNALLLLGINAVLYYTPQILEQAGVQVLLSDLGMSPESASLFISAVMTMLMLPAVTIAMKLMDVSGRRGLLLSTNPILTASLVILVMVRVVNVSDVIKAAVSTASVLCYSSFFAMGYGPIPNILCAEIFPTKVRAMCMPICALTFWLCNILITFTLPLMLSSIGLAGCFTIFALVSILSWAFVHFKVPETKGMPIEVIVDFFAVGANANN